MLVLDIRYTSTSVPDQRIKFRQTSYTNSFVFTRCPRLCLSNYASRKDSVLVSYHLHVIAGQCVCVIQKFFCYSRVLTTCMTVCLCSSKSLLLFTGTCVTVCLCSSKVLLLFTGTCVTTDLLTVCLCSSKVLQVFTVTCVTVCWCC